MSCPVGVHAPTGLSESLHRHDRWKNKENLFLASPATRGLVHDGKVKVFGAIYDVATGRIGWLPESKTMDLLKQVEANPNRAVNAVAEEKR